MLLNILILILSFISINLVIIYNSDKMINLVEYNMI